MKTSGIITITTDFGHKGPFAAVMKGVILSHYPDARIIDLAHDIPAQWPPEAGFWVSRSYHWFPEGSVHLAIVDPGVGTERDILVAECDGHVFMAPDNGLLAQLFAELAAGRIASADIGTQTQDWTPGWIDEPDVAAGKVTGVIVTVDTFGNLISNIDASLLDGFKQAVADIAGHEIPMQTTYGRARPGDYLALVNSFGVIEIARAEGSAADGLGSARGAPLIIRDGYKA
jgi:S-adenosylmethionine hydrolase